MTANAAAAEAGEAKEDAASATKNAELKAEAEQLKNEVHFTPTPHPPSPHLLDMECILCCC